MRHTPQFGAITAALALAEGPLTARELHRKARESVPALGLATVYRCLARLQATGEVTAVHLPRDAVRYELAGKGHHHHFRCLRCANVFELEAPCPVAVLEGATLPGGLTVLGHELTLFGLCATCSGEEAGSPAPRVTLYS